MIEHFQIKIKRGSLTIKPSPDDQWHLESEPELVPDIGLSGVTINAEAIPGPVYATVLVPGPGEQLDASIGRGPCTIEGLAFRQADVNLGLGDLTLKDAKGNWDLNLGKGDAFLEQVEGKLDINLGMGRLDMRAVTATADINNGLGSVHGQSCDGRYDINAGKGDVHWTHCQGSAEVNAGMGTIRVQHGHGDNLNLNAGLGKVFVTEGDWNRVRIDTGLGDVEVSSKTSDLTVHVKQRGNIRVSLADDIDARVEASTDRGRIVSHLAMIPVGHAGPQRGERLVGTLGDGHGQIDLATRRGDVTLSLHPAGQEGPHPEVSRDPQESRAFILDQLQRGQLTVDEAEALLEALDDESQT